MALKKKERGENVDWLSGYIYMPTKEAIVKNEDDSYTIFINAWLNYEQQMNSYLHAMKHIAGEDFQKNDIQHIEYLAHG